MYPPSVWITGKLKVCIHMQSGLGFKWYLMARCNRSSSTGQLWSDSLLLRCKMGDKTHSRPSVQEHIQVQLLGALSNIHLSHQNEQQNHWTGPRTTKQHLQQTGSNERTTNSFGYHTHTTTNTATYLQAADTDHSHSRPSGPCQALCPLPSDSSMLDPTYYVSMDI